jgi:hypothetical protein
MSEALRKLIDADQGGATKAEQGRSNDGGVKVAADKSDRKPEFDIFSLCKGCNAWLNKPVNGTRPDEIPAVALDDTYHPVLTEFDKSEAEESGSKAPEICLLSVSEDL